MQWRGGLGERRRLLLSLLLCFCVVLQPAETLRVTMETKLTGFLNSDISLPCNISGYNTPELDIERIAVTWFLKTTGGNEKRQVYSVVAGKHVSRRNGAQLDENELKKGNATLSLPQIQLNEAGTYMCSVVVTPDRDEGTTILEIVETVVPGKRRRLQNALDKVVKALNAPMAIPPEILPEKEDPYSLIFRGFAGVFKNEPHQKKARIVARCWSIIQEEMANESN